MNSLHYYNDSDPHACHRLRSLISAGLIPAGHVDQRSIADVRPADLAGFVQCHFFAGIGGWAEALRLAGVQPDVPLWTGSCPCQPFSAAGKRKGTADERHLWPVFRDLIAECKPPVVFGEQVASADGRNWLSVVRSEMEALGYAVGAADLCAAGVGAPHIRQRLYFVGLADADDTRSETIWGKGYGKGATTRRQGDQRELGIGRIDGRLADARGNGREQGGSGAALLALPGEQAPAQSERREQAVSSERGSRLLRLADTDGGRCQQWDTGQRHLSISDQNGEADIDDHADEKNSFWGTADWLWCRDGKWRPVEPGLEPLAHGVSGRVALLRGYGNAIVPQVAAVFIRAALNLP